MATRVLIIGCGDVGTTLGLQLTERGFTVTGVRRSSAKLPDSFHKVSADLNEADNFIQTLAQHPAEIVVFSAAASQHDENGYRTTYLNGINNTLKAIAQWPQPPAHIFFTSSTAVYHQADHSWVDENSATEPTRFSGQLMLQAEQALAAADIPSSTIRFSGIYGPGRTRLLEAVKSGKGAPPEPLSYSNRIHRDDCAGVLSHLIHLQQQGQKLQSIYLASDHQPVPLHEVTQWLATQMQSELTDLSMGRFAGSKRCNNQRLIDSGYHFKYPDFSSGYQHQLPTTKEQ